MGYLILNYFNKFKICSLPKNALLKDLFVYYLNILRRLTGDF